MKDTVKTRFEQALRCEKPDQVPFLPAIYEHKAWFVGETPSRLARDARLLEAALTAEYEQVQPDALTIGVDVYNVEAEAMGCQVTYYDDDPTAVPAISPTHTLFRALDGVSSLRMPDPDKDGRMPLFLDAARRMARTLGKEVPLRGAVSGPFSLAAHIAGFMEMHMLLVMQPSVAHELLDFAAEVIKRYGAAFVNAGCGVIVFDSHASPDLLSPSMYREFVLEPTRGIVEHFRHKGVNNVPLIIGGNTTSMLDEYLDTGASNILCDAKADPAVFLEKCFPRRRAFRRNLDSAKIGDATEEEIFRWARVSLEQSRGYEGFILGTGVLPYGVPLSHLAAIREAIRDYKTAR